MKRHGLLVLLLFLPPQLHVHGEDEISMMRVTVACPIVSVKKGEGNERIATISRGRADGVVIGWRGAAKAVRLKKGQNSKINSEYIGWGEVIQVAERNARIRVRVTNHDLVAGDVIEISCRVPQRERGTLWNLCRLHIQFRNADTDHRYFTYRQLFADGSAEHEGKILAKMLERIRESGRQFGEQPQLQVVLKAGRYKGQTGADLMVKAKEEHLRAFLQFVESYPGKYFGGLWRIDETYATWLINEAPYSAVELAKKLATATDATARAALLPTDKAMAIEVLRILCSLAENKLNENALAAASELAQRFPDIDYTVNLMFTRAYISAGKGNHERAIKEYEETIRVGIESNKRGLAGVAASNCANALSYLGRTQDATAMYRKAGAILEDTTSYRSSYARARRLLADLLRQQAEHVEAVAFYEEAIQTYRSLASFAGINKALTGKAKSLAKLGRNKEAAAVYGELREENQRLGDERAEATTLENAGSQLWGIGDWKNAALMYEKCRTIRLRLKDERGLSSVLDNIARLHFNAGRMDKARAAYAEARALYVATNQPGNVAEVDAMVGQLETRTGLHAQGLARLTGALNELRRLRNKQGELDVLETLARVYEERFEFDAARTALDQAIEIAEERNARGELIPVLRWRSTLTRRLGDRKAARSDLDKSLELARATGERGEEALTLIALSQSERDGGDRTLAIKHARAAQELAVELGGRLIEAKALQELGFAYGSQYDAERAKDAFQAARRIYSSPGVNDPATAASVRYNGAIELHELGLWKQAMEQAKLARDEAYSARANDLVLNVTLTIAEIHVVNGDFEDAKRELDEAIEETKGGSWSRASALRVQARLRNAMGAYRLAIESAKVALDIFERQRSAWNQSDLHTALASYLRRAGDPKAARIHSAEALKFAEQAGDIGLQMKSLRSAASDARLSDDFATALELLRRARVFAVRTGSKGRVALVDLGIGRTLRLAGSQPEAARKSLESATAAFRQLGATFREAEALLELCEIDLDPQRIRRATQLAEQTGSPRLTWLAYDLLSRERDKAGDLGAALTARTKAIEHLETIRAGIGSDPERQRHFLRSKIRVYESMADLLGRQMENETDVEKRKQMMQQALAFLARARFEILRNGSGDIKQGGSKAVDRLLAQIDRAKREIEQLETKIREARERGNTALVHELTQVLATSEELLAELHDNLAAADPDFAARIKFNPAYFEGWELLPKNARLLLYFPGETRLYIWVYGPDGFIAWKQHAITRAELYRKIDQFRDGIDEVIAKARTSKGRGFGPVAEANEDNPQWYRKNCKTMREVLTQLHGHLLGPVAAEIQKADPLFILPYGRLSYLPFEALIAADGKFVGENKRLAYFVHKDHMSRTLNRAAKQRKITPDYWVAYADPVGKLQSALEEVAEIQPLFAKTRVHTQESGTATEKQLLRTPADCTILHFATHGYLNGVKPSDTYIELAPEPPQDGRLMQKEIWPRLRRKLPCLRSKSLRLVVLSACETARAASAPEAEVLGLPDKFAAAGAPAIVASLWSVYTWSTTDLMVEFYRRLQEPNAGTEVSAALRDARRAMLKDKNNGRYAHPYYWAPFLLFGDWR